MIVFIFYILLIFFIIALIFLSVDAYFWWMERYPRYKIGKWKNDEEWANQFYSRGKKWLSNVPSIPITQNRHLLLWDILNNKFTRKSVQAWQTGGLLSGVLEYNQVDSLENWKTIKNKYIDETGHWIVQPKNVDYAILAFAILKNTSDVQSVKPAMDELIQSINEHMGEDGLIAYSGRNNIRYVDTIGLVCPFLILYANTYQQPQYIKLSLSQIEGFLQHGLYPSTLLPAHSYSTSSGLPVGVFGWGRGAGWLILGLIDTFLELKPSVEKDHLKITIKKFADCYADFQREDGGFGIFLQDKNTYDSSATAIFAYYYAVCYQIFEEPIYFSIVKNSLEKLKTNTRRNGALDYCQGDTVDVGVFSLRLDIMPFAQGMTLRALNKYQHFITK